MNRPLAAALLVPLLLGSVSAHAIVARPGQHACTMEAMQCPDGSYVSRTGPNCEFAPCPGNAPQAPKPPIAPMPVRPVPPAGGGGEGGSVPGSPGETQPGASGSIESGEAVAEPGVVVSPDQPDLPDEPLAPPPGPLSVKFVVEHRSALDGQHVTVHGTVVWALLAAQACPPDRGACAEARILIADSADDSRNKAYDMMVKLPEGDNTPYAKGQIVDISGTVDMSTGAVVIQRD